MSASPQASTAEAWIGLILGTVDPSETWTAIFARLRESSLSNPGAAALHRETIVPDRLLAETAWDLWQQFPRCTQPSSVNSSNSGSARPAWARRCLFLTAFRFANSR